MSNNNPSAFPEVPGDSNGYEGRPGMTLRDWFAGSAPITMFDAAMACGLPGLESDKAVDAQYRAMV